MTSASWTNSGLGSEPRIRVSSSTRQVSGYSSGAKGATEDRVGRQRVNLPEHRLDALGPKRVHDTVTELGRLAAEVQRRGVEPQPVLVVDRRPILGNIRREHALELGQAFRENGRVRLGGRVVLVEAAQLRSGER